MQKCNAHEKAYLLLCSTPRDVKIRRSYNERELDVPALNLIVFHISPMLHIIHENNRSVIRN